MSISFVGVFLILYVGYLFFHHKDSNSLLIALFSLNLLFEGFINIGYFASIGGQVFKVPDFLQFATVIVAVFCLHGKISGRLLMFILSVLISLVLISFIPYNEMVRSFNALDRVVDLSEYMHYPSLDIQAIKTTIRMICFAVNGYAVSRVILREEWDDLIEKYFKYGRILFIYVWVEFVFKNILNSNAIQNVINFFFGASQTSVSSLYRNGLRVLQGLNNEPSQFTMMVYSYWLIFILCKEWKRLSAVEIWITLSSTILVFLSGSFRVVGLLPIIILLYLIISEKPIISIIIFAFIALGLAVADAFGYLDYYFNRLNNSILFLQTGNSMLSGGEAGRLYTITEAFKVFFKRPLFGIGPGQTFAYGFIPSILAMTGLFGFFTWYNVIFGDIGEYREKKNKRTIFLSIAIISFSWVYTDSIAIAYSIYVIAIALAIRFYWDDLSGKQEYIRND